MLLTSQFYFIRLNDSTMALSGTLAPLSTEIKVLLAWTSTTQHISNSAFVYLWFPWDSKTTITCLHNINHLAFVVNSQCFSLPQF